MLVAFLLSVFLGCTSIVSGSKPRGRRATKIVETEHEKMVREMFPPVKMGTLYLPMTDLPDELWLYLASYLDAASLWNLGLTCKTIGAILRKPEGFSSLYKNFSPPELLNMLAASELTIGDWADHLMTPVNLVEMKILKNEDNRFAQITGMKYDDEKLIVDTFLPRAKNLFVEQILQVRIGKCKFVEIEEIPEALKGKIFYFRNGMVDRNRMVFLPENKEQKLFALVDPSILGKMTWSCCRLGTFTLFVFSILADYILPAWRKEYTLSDHEKTCIKALVTDFSIYYEPYIINLVWAMFFITGTKHKSEATTIKPITKFLEELGFEWKDIILNRRDADFASETAEQLKDLTWIYAVAVQWKLDLKKLAENTPSNPISQQVLKGEVPSYIMKLAEINEECMLNIAQEGLKPDLKKVEFEEGGFVLTDEPANLKRKREDDDTDGPAENKRHNHGQQVANPYVNHMLFPPIGPIFPYFLPFAPTPMGPANPQVEWNMMQQAALLRQTMQQMQLLHQPVPNPFQPFVAQNAGHDAVITEIFDLDPEGSSSDSK